MSVNGFLKTCLPCIIAVTASTKGDGLTRRIGEPPGLEDVGQHLTRQLGTVLNLTRKIRHNVAAEGWGGWFIISLTD